MNVEHVGLSSVSLDRSSAICDDTIYVYIVRLQVLTRMYARYRAFGIL